MFWKVCKIPDETIKGFSFQFSDIAADPNCPKLEAKTALTYGGMIANSFFISPF